MSDINMAIGAIRVADFVSDFSPARRSLLRKTLDGLSRFSDGRRRTLLVELSSFIQSETRPTEEEMKSFPESEEDLAQYLSSVTTLLSFLRGGETGADILSGVGSALNLSEPTKLAVSELLQAIEERRSELDAGRDQQKLADATLPSLERTHFSVDLRVQVKDGQVVLHTPVVIAHFDTDAMNQELWFQMSKMELEKLQKDLSRVSVKLDALEKWAENRK